MRFIWLTQNKELHKEKRGEESFRKSAIVCIQNETKPFACAVVFRIRAAAILIIINIIVDKTMSIDNVVN